MVHVRQLAAVAFFSENWGLLFVLCSVRMGTWISDAVNIFFSILAAEEHIRDKQGFFFVLQAVVPGPAEHPLQYNYTFWYSRRTPGRPTSSQSYEQNIKQIGTFASVSISLLCLYLLGVM